MFGFLKKLFGNKQERDIKVILPIVDDINNEYKKLSGLSNDELRNKTLEFRNEIKEYLTQIYGLPVRKVNTSIYLGKRKLVRGSTQVIRYKYKDFKKAIVSFDRSYTDVGKGTRIPEIDDDEKQDTLAAV